LMQQDTDYISTEHPMKIYCFSSQWICNRF
jgi:hypothetical protein